MSHRRSRERNRRLKRLYYKTKNSCRGGAYYDTGKKRYIKYYISNKSGNSKMLRKLTNKKIRNMDLETKLKGNQYRKTFDYWWTLF